MTSLPGPSMGMSRPGKLCPTVWNPSTIARLWLWPVQEKKPCIPWRCCPCHKQYGSYTVFFIIMRLHVPLNAQLFYLDAYMLDSVVPEGLAKTVASWEAVESSPTHCFWALWVGLHQSAALLLGAGRPLGKAALGRGSWGHREDAFQPSLLSTGVTELIQAHVAVQVLLQQEKHYLIRQLHHLHLMPKCVKGWSYRGKKYGLGCHWFSATQPPSLYLWKPRFFHASRHLFS